MQLVAKLHSPLKVRLPRKTKEDKQFILNLNNYRNAHYHILNQAKQIYKETMKHQINALPALTMVAVRFVFYPKTQRITDTANVCSIHEKFFMDAVVELGKLPGDDYRYHVETGYKFGYVDPHNPRVEAEIYKVTR